LCCLFFCLLAIVLSVLLSFGHWCCLFFCLLAIVLSVLLSFGHWCCLFFCLLVIDVVCSSVFWSLMLSVLLSFGHCVVCSSVFWSLMLSVLLRYTDYDYLFGIFKLFLWTLNEVALSSRINDVLIDTWGKVRMMGVVRKLILQLTTNNLS
jgi:hypothetical protein